MDTQQRLLTVLTARIRQSLNRQVFRHKEQRQLGLVMVLVELQTLLVVRAVKLLRPLVLLLQPGGIMGP